MKPAIFNTDMVRAILDDRKTQTRRIMKPQPTPFLRGLGISTEKYGYASTCIDDFKSVVINFSPYKKGDIIYVRETWNAVSEDSLLPEEPRRLINGKYVVFRADGEKEHPKYGKALWKPSIHMPKEYARLFLRVKDVRIDRLNEISEEDAKAEGCWYGKGCGEVDPPLGNDLFPNLWESIYGKGSFNNDYVWAIEFEKITKEEAYNDKPR